MCSWIIAWWLCKWCINLEYIEPNNYFVALKIPHSSFGSMSRHRHNRWRSKRRLHRLAHASIGSTHSRLRNVRPNRRHVSYAAQSICVSRSIFRCRDDVICTRGNIKEALSWGRGCDQVNQYLLQNGVGFNWMILLVWIVFDPWYSKYIETGFIQSYAFFFWKKTSANIKLG